MPPRASRRRNLFPQVEADAPIEFQEIHDGAVAEVLGMEPFGHGNPAPVFVASDVEVVGTPAVWRERHLQISLRQNGRTLTLKGWNLAERALEIGPGARIDAAFSFESDDYALSRGYPGWCAVLKDFRK